MSCPCLPSTVVFFGLLIVCIYNTFFNCFSEFLYKLFLGTLDIVQRNELIYRGRGV